MTRQDYLNQNAKGFEGDESLKDEFKALVDKFKINAIVETGTYRGATTKRLIELAREVHSIEINENNFREACENCTHESGINLYLDSSEKALPKLIDKLKEENKNILFFLDAHWNDYNPLLDELKIIANKGLSPVIAIHDFKVPETDLGFDSYNGQDYDFNWIESSLKEIYPEGFNFHFNDETKSTGARRGVIFIYPIQ